MAVFCNAGLNLIASAVQSPGVNCAVSYVAIGTGAGTVSSAIAASTPITSLPLDAATPANLSSSQGLTVTDGVHSETVTTSGSVSAGATSIPINSWTPAHSYAAHTTAVVPTPLAGDLTLYNETNRVAATIGSAGAGAGESLNTGYFDGTQATAVYMTVGYFGGATASISANSGTMIAEDIQYWNHTVNADSSTYQLDSTI